MCVFVACMVALISSLDDNCLPVHFSAILCFAGTKFCDLYVEAVQGLGQIFMFYNANN